jgi:hypothetical protein
MKNNWKKYGNDAHVPAARARASETKRSVSRRPSPQLAKGPNPKTARVRLSPSTARKGGGEAKGREGAGRPDNLLVLIGGGRPAKAACTTVLSPCLQTSATHMVSAKERLLLRLAARCGLWPSHNSLVLLFALIDVMIARLVKRKPPGRPLRFIVACLN